MVYKGFETMFDFQQVIVYLLRKWYTCFFLTKINAEMTEFWGCGEMGKEREKFHRPMPCPLLPRSG